MPETVGRSPCGERGLKYKTIKGIAHKIASLPVRGAWVEISKCIVCTTLHPRRSPCGERGLKCADWGLRPLCGSRSPCGERGLKLINQRETPRACQSLPVRGAWVEISAPSDGKAKPSRRSPCGERGLKFRAVLANLHKLGSLPVRGAWVEIASVVSLIQISQVAPRAGSVG